MCTHDENIVGCFLYTMKRGRVLEMPINGAITLVKEPPAKRYYISYKPDGTIIFISKEEKPIDDIWNYLINRVWNNDSFQKIYNGNDVPVELLKKVKAK